MHITAVELTDFRNFRHVAASFSKDANLIFGRNASGKTNLLEAVQFGCTGTSERTRQPPDLVRWGSDIARVVISAFTERRQDSVSVEVAIPTRGARRLTVNGARRPLDEGSGLAVVGFFPDDLKVVKAGPEFRRAFLDQALGQVRPRYGALRRELADVLKQRNALLRQLCAERDRTAHGGRPALEVWDGQLAERTAAVLGHRLWFLDKLAPRAAQHFGALSGRERSAPDAPPARDARVTPPSHSGGPGLAVHYQSRSLEEASPETGQAAELARALAAGEETARRLVEEATLRVIARLREAELARGVTLVGPQRDDILLLSAGVSLRDYGSQGEQRTAALALKLAELDLVTSELGEWPVLLLDDVMSELDEGRRAALVKLVESGPQCLITSTNPGYFSEGTLEAAHVIEISDGGISEVGSHAQA